MRVCLIPLKTEIRNLAANFHHLCEKLETASEHKPDLIGLPECTLTGYLYENEDFERFAEPIPGRTTQLLAELARRYHVYLCFGLLERTVTGVYNAAVLMDKAGNIIHKHRKIIEQPPFLNGDTVASVETEFGKLAILICGDLFHKEVVTSLDHPLQLLIVPIARSFDGRSPDPARWMREERQAYLNAVKMAGHPTVLINALEMGTTEPSFGGAMVVRPNGELLAEAPHGTDEILIYNFDKESLYP